MSQLRLSPHWALSRPFSTPELTLQGGLGALLCHALGEWAVQAKKWPDGARAEERPWPHPCPALVREGAPSFWKQAGSEEVKGCPNTTQAEREALPPLDAPSAHFQAPALTVLPQGPCDGDTMSLPPVQLGLNPVPDQAFPGPCSLSSSSR